jgi:DNA-binding transcriptional regulator YiaG
MDDNLTKTIIKATKQSSEPKLSTDVISEKAGAVKSKSTANKQKNGFKLVVVKSSKANGQSRLKPPSASGRVRNPIQIGSGVLYPVPNKRVLDAFKKDSVSGENIKAFRQAIKLNVRDFATFIGVDPATVFRWETQRTCKLQTASKSKILKLVNNVAAGKKVRLPQWRLMSAQR